MKKKCFIILSGQYENYGDVMHRRGLLNVLHDYSQIYALAPGNNQNFKCLIDDERIIWIESPSQWLMEMFYVNNIQSDIYFCSGEMNTKLSRIVKELCLLIPFYLRSKLGGATINRVGIGLGKILPKNICIWKFIFKFSDKVIFRTKKDFNLMNIGDGYVPDLAYFSSKNRLIKFNSEKTEVALSFRGDRKILPDIFFQNLFAFCSTNSLIPYIYSQVEFDDEISSYYSQKYEINMVTSTQIPLSEREKVMRNLFPQTKYLLSDRLHSLILGHINGIQPIYVDRGNSSKVMDHFEIIDPNIEIITYKNHFVFPAQFQNEMTGSTANEARDKLIKVFLGDVSRFEISL